MCNARTYKESFVFRSFPDPPAFLPSPKVVPTCKINHVVMRAALLSFYKLYPHLLGEAPGEDRDLLTNQLSFHIRVLLAMVRRCRKSVHSWQTCQRTYKGAKADLEVVAGILARMQVDSASTEEETSAESMPVAPCAVPNSQQAIEEPIDWNLVQMSAPRAELFQVSAIHGSNTLRKSHLQNEVWCSLGMLFAGLC